MVWNCLQIPIDQFRYIKIQPNTIDLSTRLWGITTEFVGFIPQSLVLRSIVLGWILIYWNWSIVSVLVCALKIFSHQLFTKESVICFRQQCYKCVLDSLQRLLVMKTAPSQSPGRPTQPGPPPTPDPNAMTPLDADKLVSFKLTFFYQTWVQKHFILTFYHIIVVILVQLICLMLLGQIQFTQCSYWFLFCTKYDQSEIFRFY